MQGGTFPEGRERFPFSPTHTHRTLIMCVHTFSASVAGENWGGKKMIIAENRDEAIGVVTVVGERKPPRIFSSSCCSKKGQVKKK